MPLSASRKLFFTSKLLGGVFKSGTPGFSGVNYINGTPNGSFSSSNIPLPWALCYQVSTGLELGLTKTIGLITDLGFFNGKSVWRYEIWNYNNNSAPTAIPMETKYSFSSVNLLIGIKVNL